MRDTLLVHFPRGQGRSLATRPGFVAVNVEFPACRLRRVERCRGRADIHEGQPSGVAMGQHAHALADQRSPVLPDFPTMPHVLLRERPGRFHRERLLFRHRRSRRHLLPDAGHGIDRIHRRWPRFLQVQEHALDMALKRSQSASTELPRALRQPERRRGTDGPRPAHHHVADGRRGLPMRRHRHDLEPVRQQPLVDQPHRIRPFIKLDRPERLCFPTLDHVHAP